MKYLSGPISKITCPIDKAPVGPKGPFGIFLAKSLILYFPDMNTLLAASRGIGLDKLVGKTIREASFSSSHIMPGATIRELTEELDKIIPQTIHTSDIPHIYIMAGVPDITTLAKGKKGGRLYRECIYTGDTGDKIEYIKREIDHCDNEITRRGARPIFCTITHMNIGKYNHFLLEKGRTTELKHEHNYSTMQTQVDHIIAHINTYIRNTNRKNRVSTPFCHSTVMKRHGKKPRGYYKPDWEALYDGIHGTDQTKEKWGHTLETAISLNRRLRKPKRKLQASSSEDETLSPKRSWLRERGASTSGITHA